MWSKPKKGRYFRSLKEWVNYGGSPSDIKNRSCIHVTGSVKGTRKMFWGYECDVVRCGSWIYKVN